MNKILTRIKASSFLSIGFYVLLGAVLLLFPATTADLIAYSISIFLIVKGALRVIHYIKQKDRANRNDLMAGIILVSAAILLFIFKGLVVSIMPFVLGTGIILSGIQKLIDAIQLKKLKQSMWMTILAMGIVCLAFGIIMVMNPFSVAMNLLRWLGVGLIFSGFTDLVSTIAIGKKSNRNG